MAKMAGDKEQQLLTAAETQAKEIKAQREREAAEQAAREQLAQKIEAHIPAEPLIREAQAASGVQGDPKEIRDRMKAHVAQELAEGTLKPGELDRPYPFVGAAFVGTGAVTSDELKVALAKQAELTAEARSQAAAEAQAQGKPAPDPETIKGPQIGEVLRTIYKDDPARLDKLDKASKFYDALKAGVDQQQNEAAIERHVPSEETIEEARKKAELDGDAKAIRDAMRARLRQQLANRQARREDLGNSGPSLETALVSTGALTEDELKAATDKQVELTPAGAQPPPLAAVLKQLHTGDKYAKIEKAIKFQQELEAARQRAAAAEPDPFGERFTTLSPRTDAPVSPAAATPPATEAPVPPAAATPPATEAPVPPAAATPPATEAPVPPAAATPPATEAPVPPAAATPPPAGMSEAERVKRLLEQATGP
jgi:hypothetical protein